MNGVLVRLETFAASTVLVDRFVEVMSGPPESFDPGPRRRGRVGGA